LKIGYFFTIKKSYNFEYFTKSSRFYTSVQGHEQFLKCAQNAPLEDVLFASDREPLVTFRWTPVVDKNFLMEVPTLEYMSTPGLLDRFDQSGKYFPVCSVIHQFFG